MYHVPSLPANTAIFRRRHPHRRKRFFIVRCMTAFFDGEFPMNIFDIIGPIMIGPSSSHTAGAARIGKTSATILADTPMQADIGLTGSFAQTCKGHGTDKALIGGILGFCPDDERIRNSMEIAGKQGLSFTFKNIHLPKAHPNTAVIHLAGKEGKECSIQGASVGGGAILISKVNGLDTFFTGEHETIIIPHRDEPGTIAAVTALVADSGINIGNFRLHRPGKGDEAMMTMEVDGAVKPDVVEKLCRLKHVVGVVHLAAL